MARAGPHGARQSGYKTQSARIRRSPARPARTAPGPGYPCPDPASHVLMTKTPTMTVKAITVRAFDAFLLAPSRSRLAPVVARFQRRNQAKFQPSTSARTMAMVAAPAVT